MAQRPNDLSPERGGWHLWGAQLRSLRERSDYRSGIALARAINCDPSLISKYENATRRPHYEQVIRLDAVLHANGTLTRLHASITAAESAEDKHTESSSLGGYDGILSGETQGRLVPVTDAEGRTIYVPMSRRGLLKSLGAVAGVVALGDGLAAATPSESGCGLVEHFRQMRSTLADNDNLFGAHRVTPVAQQQLDRMHAFNSSMRGDALRDFFHVQTEFADLLGWLHEDAGDYMSAQYWAGRALDFAHLSGSPIDVAFVLARRSQIAADMGDASTAVLSAEAAMNTAGTNKRITAIAATQLGHASALEGDGRASDAAYDRARELLTDHAGDDEPWGQFFSHEYINVFSAHSAAALGRYGDALAEYDAAIAALPPSFRRDQAVYLAHQARTLAQSGDHDSGASLGINALLVNAETGSARGLREIAALDRMVGRSDTQSIRQFREMFALTKTEA